MHYFDSHPHIDFGSPQTEAFLNIWFNKDNVLRGKTTEINYANNIGNFSIKAVLKGSITYVVDGSEKQIEPGYILTINKGTIYQCYSKSNEAVEDVCLQITDSSLSECFRSLSCTTQQLLDQPFDEATHLLPAETISFADDYFLKLIKEISQPNIDRLNREELKIKILSRYFTHFYSGYVSQIHSIKNENVSTRLELFRRVHRAKDFLHSNYTNDIDLGQISKAAFISPSHLIRKFKEVLHITPYQYLRKLRLQKAIELITTSHLPIDQITTLVGFESTSSFIRIFREVYGVTPNSLRKKAKSDVPEETMLA